MAGRKQGNHRSKPRKGMNRYDPNNPNWQDVHGRWFPLGALPPLDTAGRTKLSTIIRPDTGIIFAPGA